MLTSFSLFLLTACDDMDEGAGTLIEYNNEEWVPINEKEYEKLNDLPRKMTELENEGKEEEIIALIKEDILPTLDETLDRLEDVELEHEKVKKLNDLQMEAEQSLKDTTKQDIIYYEGGNVSEGDITQNNKNVEGKFKNMNDYREKLIDKYNLEYVEDDQSLGNFRNLQRAED